MLKRAEGFGVANRAVGNVVKQEAFHEPRAFVEGLSSVAGEKLARGSYGLFLPPLPFPPFLGTDTVTLPVVSLPAASVVRTLIV